MKERLVELIEQCAIDNDMPSSDQIADYLLANGVIVPPCKVGDDIYVIEDEEVIKEFVLEVTQHRNGMWYFAYVPYDKHQKVRWFYPKGKASNSDFGKTVFLTREEAEKKLKESESK